MASNRSIFSRSTSATNDLYFDRRSLKYSALLFVGNKFTPLCYEKHYILLRVTCQPPFPKKFKGAPKTGCPLLFLPRMAHKGPLPSAGNFHLVADITALPGLHGQAVDFLPHIRPKGWTASRNFGDHKRGRRKRQGSARPVVIITNTLVKSRAPFYFCPQGPARAFCRLPVTSTLRQI